MSVSIKSIVAVCLLVLAGSFSLRAQDKPYVVVLSMDGFRWDYPDSVPTPNLAQMEKDGVRANSLIPSFPSVTFPNHYTLATGLYPDHHGLVHNSFYAPEFDATYKIGDREKVEDGRYYGGEPIWNTAEKQGVKTAAFYWVGSEAKIQGMRPSYWKPYSKNISFEQRIDTVVHWLSLPEKDRPHLIMFYFDEPDHTGHTFGPQSAEVRHEVMHLDSLVGILRQKLAQLPVSDKINFMLVADHGMGAISNDKRINIDEFVPRSWIKRDNGGTPVTTIDANEGYTDSIYNRLSKVAHLRVWKKADVPDYLHYGTNAREGELIVAADSAYSLAWKNSREIKGGAHGYDPLDTDMHAVFYAVGPAFKKDYRLPSFPNVDMYSIMAYLLNITPAQTDGSIDEIKDMFVE
jgi:alkaline phosphatase D